MNPVKLQPGGIRIFEIGIGIRNVEIVRTRLYREIYLFQLPPANRFGFNSFNYGTVCAVEVNGPFTAGHTGNIAVYQLIFPSRFTCFKRAEPLLRNTSHLVSFNSLFTN